MPLLSGRRGGDACIPVLFFGTGGDVPTLTGFLSVCVWVEGIVWEAKS